MDENEESIVSFLYKTMLTRDPKKRQVKPVQHGMILDFAELDDSEEDDDYTLPFGKGGSDEDDDIDSDDEDDQDESDDDNATDDTARDVTDNEELTIGDFINFADKPSSTISDPTVDGVISSTNRKAIKVLVCAVCLEDFSEGNDEIVECDGCGVAVHECCYGISDVQSAASTASSASTEPWFCDACKAGVTASCELCPNPGGIFKETDAGRWVHLVCALYIPGVAFGDIDLLTPVTLFEMPYSKYGAKECTLCEDVQFSRTGVCIGCDAGMCRLNFHVTCAQKQGLLSEASPDVEIADPFYAHCKQHADKLAMKLKRRNYLAMVSRMKAFSESHALLETDDKDRITRKLTRHRRKYCKGKINRPIWVPETKMPRLLTTSASAMRRLIRKAELLGVTSQTQEADTQTDIRRKRHLALAFSADYVRYYFDRNERIEECRKQVKVLEAQKRQLDRQESQLRAQYDQLTRSVNALQSHYNKNLSFGLTIWNAVTAYSKKKLPLPSYLKAKKQIEEKNCDVKPTTPSPSIIHKCASCVASHDQHLLAYCDNCFKHYHLGCLDPPLTRMPKKTKLCGWQCSECASSSSSEGDAKPDVKAPMRLRQTIKEPHKFSQQLDFEARKRKKKKRKSITKKMHTKQDDNVESEPPSKRRKLESVKKPKEVELVFSKCSVCDRESLPSQLARCDECGKCFHFICLDPPRKTTPKVRGYAWTCRECNFVESSEEDEQQDANGA